MVNYRVLSPHLDLSRDSVSKSTKINSKDIISMRQDIPVSFSSYPYGTTSPTITGDKAYLKSGGGRLHVFSKSDVLSQHGLPMTWEESGPRLAGWIANSTLNPPVNNDVIPTYYDITGNRIGGIAYIAGIKPLRMYLPHPHDTKVPNYTTPDLVVANDINRQGNRVSQLENFRQKIHSGVLFNDTNQLHYEIARWTEFLGSKGIKPVKNPLYGIGIERADDFIAGYYPKNRILVANFDFNGIVKDLMKRYGLTESEAVEAGERYAIFHELAHAYGISGTRRGEKLQGKLGAEFYTTLANESDGKWSRIYKALAQRNSDYAERFSLTNTLLREATKGPEFEYSNLSAHKFWHEGVELGYSGKALEKYVKSRMKETFEPLSEEESDDSSNLDAIVQGEERTGRARLSESKGNQTLDGKIVYLSERAGRPSRKGKENKGEKTEADGTYERKVVDISEYKNRREAERTDAKSEQAEAKEAASEAEAPAETAEAA